MLVWTLQLCKHGTIWNKGAGHGHHVSSKVRAHSRRSQVVHLNNLQAYQGRQEESTWEPSCWGSVNAPHGEGKDQQSVQPGSSKVEPMESGKVISGAKKNCWRWGQWWSSQWGCEHAGQAWVSVLLCWYRSSWRICTPWWMWSESRYIGYGGRWTCRRRSKQWDKCAGDNRRWTRGRS